MIKRTIHQLMKMIRCEAAPADADLQFHGVSTDTRTLRPGNLFIPLTGERFDGHEFAAQAAARGAAAVLWQQDRPGAPEGVPVIRVPDTLAALQELAAAYRRELPVRIIGITGSNGKTTTKDMVAACLMTTYKVHKTQGNLNNHIGLPLTILQMDEDTQMAVLEMGMSGSGEIALLSKIALPETAIITNIGEAHLQQLGSREAIARAKLEIIEGLREDGLLIYNGDEPLLVQLVAGLEGRQAMLRFRFGAQDTNDYYPLALIHHQDYISFKLNVPFSPTFTIPLPGRHNIVMSRNPAYAAAGCTVVHSLEKAIAAAGDVEEIAVIGGEEIYRLFLPITDRIHLTIVHAELEGDTRFPPLSEADWRTVERIERPADERNPYALTFLELQRV